MSSDSPEGRVARTDRGRPDAGAGDIHFANGLGTRSRARRTPSQRAPPSGRGPEGAIETMPRRSRPSRPDQFPPKGTLKFDSPGPGIPRRNFCRSTERQEFWEIRKFLELNSS